MSQEPNDDPISPEVQAAPDEDPPADDSFLMGVSGVEEQVLAEAARAEGELASGDQPDDGNEKTVV